MKPIILATAIAAFVSGGVLAHSKEETTEPADRAEVEMVEEVVLEFDKPMRVTAISIDGGSGSIELSSEQGTEPTTRYVVKPQADLEPGSYKVEWRGLSSDGHPMKGDFAFDVSP
ncbi:copper resistance protein CopC [Fulvimarina sp. MAC3]|uniref:copper resistance CopC family protein n=1 Tax=Fulvimarina sp. MAC3 TaxID=3148887 RepID=UPI0031FDDAE5